MGYHSRLRGEVKITPELRWSQFKDSPWNGIEKAQKNHKGLFLLVDEEDVDTDDGPLKRWTAYAVGYAWPRPEKIGDIVEEFQELVDQYPDHQFVGAFEGEGNDFGDIWLLRVDENRKVQRVLPTITWPDGTVLRNERYE